MVSTSLARSVLNALIEISQDGPLLNNDDRTLREPAFRRLFQTIGKLEVICERRVDQSEYEAYRRALEACHVEIPGQAQHG